MEQHRLLTWDPEFRELFGFDNTDDICDDIYELNARDVPWCWLSRKEGNSWQIHLDGQGGGELYYASLME